MMKKMERITSPDITKTPTFVLQLEKKFGKKLFKQPCNEIQSISVITDSSGPTIFVRFNRVNLCTKIWRKNLFVNNRARYNLVSL